MISSTSAGSAAASVGGRRVAGEQRRRDHVDAGVRRLRRQDRRRQQLERVAVVELADRVRVRLGEPPGDLPGPPLRRPRADAPGGGGGGLGRHGSAEPTARVAYRRAGCTTGSRPPPRSPRSPTSAPSTRLLDASSARRRPRPAVRPPAPRPRPRRRPGVRRDHRRGRAIASPATPSWRRSTAPATSSSPSHPDHRERPDDRPPPAARRRSTSSPATAAARSSGGRSTPTAGRRRARRVAPG